MVPSLMGWFGADAATVADGAESFVDDEDVSRRGSDCFAPSLDDCFVEQAVRAKRLAITRFDFTCDS